MNTGPAEQSVWIDWRQMHPLVDPASLDSVRRAQIAAAQAPANANRPLVER